MPSEKKIVESLKKLENAPQKYKALYNLLLDSGLRLVEAVNLINKFNGVKDEKGLLQVCG